MSPDLLAGRYELIERLAGGGMGQVWRGRDQVLERIVAIKTVDLTAQDPTMRERFRREAVATAGLSAPNVVQVYDAGTHGDTAYLVMELLTGPSLSQLIHDHGPLPIDEGVHVTQETVKGLLAAHRIGVIHRDIKPGNVMYHGDQIKLVDFGIAQLTRTMGAQLTAPATALGTAAYMSPEQASGDGASEKSDWYALGCLMMTMFTGEPPFRGEALAVVTQQITAKPPSLSQRRKDVPPALDQLVARMLAKDPNQRPTGEQILDQLRLIQVDPNAGTILMPAGAPTAATALMTPTTAGFDTGVGFAQTPAEPPTGGAVAPVRPAAPARPERKSRFWPVVAGLVLFLLIGVGAVYAAVTLSDRSEIPPVTTPSPSATATPTPSRTPTSAPTTRRTIIPPAVTTRTTTTRPPTTTPAPTTTEPAEPTAEPTAAPTTTEPTTAPTTTEGSGDSGNGNGNSGNGNNGNGNNGNGNNGNGNGNTEPNENAGPNENASGANATGARGANPAEGRGATPANGGGAGKAGPGGAGAND